MFASTTLRDFASHLANHPTELNGDLGMRMLFTFALLSAIAFSGVTVAQETANDVDEIPVAATENLANGEMRACQTKVQLLPPLRMSSFLIRVSSIQKTSLLRIVAASRA